MLVFTQRDLANNVTGSDPLFGWQNKCGKIFQTKNFKMRDSPCFYNVHVHYGAQSGASISTAPEPSSLCTQKRLCSESVCATPTLVAPIGAEIAWAQTLCVYADWLRNGSWLLCDWRWECATRVLPFSNVHELPASLGESRPSFE